MEDKDVCYCDKCSGQEEDSKREYDKKYTKYAVLVEVTVQAKTHDKAWEKLEEILEEATLNSSNLLGYRLESIIKEAL